MAEPALLDRTFSVIMNRMVETGRAPHFAEIATELGVSPVEGRAALQKLFSVRGLPGFRR
jgi:predicted DNA-binding transcriptional regulator